MRPLDLTRTNKFTPADPLSISHGRLILRPEDWPTLRVDNGSKFKIVQIPNAHIFTSVGKCINAVNAGRRSFSMSRAHLLTVRFIGDVIDAEELDLVIFIEDYLHYDILNSDYYSSKAFCYVIKC